MIGSRKDNGLPPKVEISQQPLISVVMPVRDGSMYIRQAIESILSQSLGQFELIVVDDGSVDGTREIATSYMSADSRVMVLGLPRVGITRALEAGRRQAKAEIIARMDSDDIAMPDRFEVQFRRFMGNPALVALGGQIEKISIDGTSIGRGRFPVSPEQCAQHLDRGAPFCHPTVMMASSALESVGGYRDRYQAAEDYDLWLRLSKVGQLANVPEVVLKYRIHTQSVTSTKAHAMAIATALALLEHRHPEAFSGEERPEATDWPAIERHLPSRYRAFARTAYFRALVLSGSFSSGDTMRIAAALPGIVVDSIQRRAFGDLWFFLTRFGYQAMFSNRAPGRAGKR